MAQFEKARTDQGAGSKRASVRSISILIMGLAWLCINAISASVATAQDDRPKEAPSPPAVVRESVSALQDDAIERVEPTYPPLARAANITGSVVVEVTVDEGGNVVAAHAISGHPLLKDSAVEAARKWKFKPANVEAGQARTVARIVFEFGLDVERQRDNSDRPSDKKVDELEKQVARNPNSPEAHYELGVAYIEIGQYEQAIAELKKSIHNDPASAGAYYKLGLAYHRSRRYSEAEDAYKAALKLDPDGPDADVAWFGLGTVELELGRYEEGTEAFKESIKLSPAVAASHLGLGVGYSLLGKYREAVGPLKRVLEIDADNAGAHFWLGEAYLELGDRQSAMAHYEALKGLDNVMADKLLSDIKKR